jgi:hypothetical protein
MEITDLRTEDLNERGETDSVSARINALAIGMVVLIAVFEVLDCCHFLPQLPGATP